MESSIPLLFRTRVTDLFGIRLPVIAGGLHWLSDAKYVSAIAEAGLIGFISAATFSDGERLRDEIRRCRDRTAGKPFGVNISMLPKLLDGERIDRVIDQVIDEGVSFVETSGRSPKPYLPRLQAAGIKVLHKAPTVRHALSAEKAGVDAVTLIGGECGGHPGEALVGSLVQGALAARRIRIPWLLAGGIGTGEQLTAALALGADGVCIGSRFLVAEEIQTHPDYKKRLIEAVETDTTLIMQSLRNTMRALKNETTATVQQIEKEYRGDEAGLLAALMPHISGRIGKKAYETGNHAHGALSVGQSIAFADRVEPIKTIVARLEAEAEAALVRLSGLVRNFPDGVKQRKR